MKKQYSIKSRFSAGHIYENRNWSGEKNKEIFGKCTTPHGHDYEVEISIVMSEKNEIENLKSALARETQKLDHRFLNDLEFFKTKVPTTENIAIYFYETLKHDFPITRLKVFEGQNCSSELLF